jgi:hypothetical protein
LQPFFQIPDLLFPALLFRASLLYHRIYLFITFPHLLRR